MRVNIYAEEMTDRIEIFEKTVDTGQTFTALRFYLYLPTTLQALDGPLQVKGPFLHHPGDDDSAAVTFWGKKDLRAMLVKAIEKLDEHHANKKIAGPGLG